MKKRLATIYLKINVLKNKTMKLKLLLGCFLLLTNLLTAFPQDSVRVVIKTPRNGHHKYGFNGPNDKRSLTYVDDEKQPFTGKFIEYNWDKIKVRESNYVNGILEGDYIEWDSQDIPPYITYIKLKCFYKNEKYFGEYTKWWDEKNKDFTCNYDEKGEIHGVYISFGRHNKDSIRSLQYYIHGKRDSIYCVRNDQGQVIKIENYKNGIKQGKWSSYYDNGILKKEETYVNDMLHGAKTEWYDNGQIKYSCIYNQEKLNGKEIFYYSNGKTEKEGEFQNGIKKGKFIWYNKDGSIQEETTF